MANSDHLPNDNFDGMIAAIHTKFFYGRTPVEVHGDLTELGYTSEQAHLLLRAAWIMGG